ncbi:MAG: bifunctional phosphoribosyl-AMP cyclohydrolase/phosphoribosyl-ATP diphosphatase HisIE [Eubacterium sp.]|nr:bifunctional phosphoribosyl-AMP cyclohydrolase/phosphoribosyl-ATP diphosphatase HisIE [Eubacterium sp.]
MAIKQLISCVYMKDGKAYSEYSEQSAAAAENIEDFIKQYNNSGVDSVFVFNLADGDREHKKNLNLLKALCNSCEIPVCVAGNIESTADIQEYLYAGAATVIVNGSKPTTPAVISEGAKRFGKHKIMVSLQDVNILFKNKEIVEESVFALVILNEKIVSSVEDLVNIPLVPMVENLTADVAAEYLSKDSVRGIGGVMLDSFENDVVALKKELIDMRIQLNKFEPLYDFDRLTTNDQGLVPCIVQDYQTNDVLMLAYMNKESFEKTLMSGRMTYYSRSRKQLWMKGETSGHLQYVKSLTADCDLDTILAKVSQIGPACHTGSRSCFFNEIIRKYYVEKNPRTVFEDVYDVITDRDKNPKDGSYTNYLIDQGMDTLLKKLVANMTDIILTAKEGNKDDLKFEISDLLYHLMVLMEQNNVTWEEVTGELVHRT